MSASTTIITLDPYKAKALPRFTSLVSYNGLSSKANTIIDATISLKFASKEFVIAKGFYKDYKTASKLSIRVARKKSISTTDYFVFQS